MKKLVFITVIFLSFGLAILLGGCAGTKPKEEHILAEFGGKVVTLEEMEQEISELSEYKQSQYKDKEGMEEYLTLMAESRMLLDVAAVKDLDKDPAILKQTQEYKDQLMVKELVKREVEDKINVTDADLMKYYEGHKADYLEPEKIVVTEISVTEEEKAKEIFQKVKDGADFTELAKEIDAKRESLGPGQGNEGKTRPFSKDSYSSAQNFVDAAFALEIGQMSDIVVQPIRDQTYYMIVRLDERIPERQKEFSEVEKSIRRTVEKQVKSDQMDRWLTAIKVEKKFQLYPDRIIVPVEAEVEGVEGTEKVQEAEVAPETSDEQGTTDETADEEKTDSKEEESPSEDSEN